MNLVLNQEQLVIADNFFEFLLSNEKELIICGPGGVGKTYLMGYLIDKVLPQYHDTCKMLGIPIVYKEVVMTAMTNQAAEVLAEASQKSTQTIHSYLNLIVKDNYTTGETNLVKTSKWDIKHNIILFIDECSMMDYKLLKLLRESVVNCKIVFVGDAYQLPPIKETVSNIYQENLPYFELTQQMRNNNKEGITKLCQQTRATIQSGIFKDIPVGLAGSHYLEAEQAEKEIITHFEHNQHNSIILTYTNNSAINYNQYIQELRGNTLPYTVGEFLVSNSTVELLHQRINTQQILKVLAVSQPEEFVVDESTSLPVYYLTLEGTYGSIYKRVPVPMNTTYFTQLVKYYKKQAKWIPYFKLKNTIADLRQTDASTVHKAQGSTYNNVFIDLNDLGTCKVPNQFSRLLYVAISRARDNIFFFGSLPKKYGEIIWSKT